MNKEIIGYTTATTVLPKVDSGPSHEYVDLGLPSGTLWATMNVGAESETDIGNYYMYGMGDKTYNVSDTPYQGTESPLPLSKDTARVVWGGDWHMPTKEQMEELKSNTTYTWTTVNGVNGGLFTAQNGNSIFIPAAGHWHNGSQGGVDEGDYWTSSPGTAVEARYFLMVQSMSFVPSNLREYGLTIRPVIG